ncbi:MAG: DUF1127 domain-containing protein [Silicimonas sp.]|nr:DUF1127 domain-containing protein [Silicimonas sp.]
MAITFSRAHNVNVADRAFLSLSGLVSSFIHWNEVRRTRAALSKLSAHELEDIGLTLGDIDQIR